MDALFYSPDLLSTGALSATDSAHCVRVLRMQPGDLLSVTDGDGNIYECRLVDANQHHAMVEIVDSRLWTPSWRGHLTIAVAPTKNMDRMEWLVEKLTEIGVDRIVPVKCSHSERKEVKTERLQRVAVSAMKQSLKGRLPQIDEMMPLDRFILNDQSDIRLMAHCESDMTRYDISGKILPAADVSVLIGPEGDFSRQEIETAVGAGVVPVTLGEERLRTETAALYAGMAFHVIDKLQQ